MSDERQGIELTPDELLIALARRQKVPFSEDEAVRIRGVLKWFDNMMDKEQERLERRTLWRARIPLIGTAISSLIALATYLANVWRTHP